MRITTEWFPIVLGTMVLSLTSWIDYTVFGVGFAFPLGKVIYFVGLGLLFLFLAMWLYGYRDPKNLREDISSPVRISFTAFLAVLSFVSGFFFTVYVSSSPQSIHLLTLLFYLGYAIALGVNVTLWAKIYLGGDVKLNYALLVPSIALSADVVLGAPILPPFSDVLSDQEVTVIYFMMLLSLGITVLQFIFLGSASLISHIQGGRNFPTIMIPLGAASIIGINVLSFPAYNYLGLLDVPVREALAVGISLFGFELWNLILGLVIALRKLRDPPSLASWAYVFPVGITMFSAYMLYQMTSLQFFQWFIASLNVVVVGLYVFSLVSLVRILRGR